jgi:hypothetical protein
MAYRHGDRNQMQLLPPSIEEYVTLDDPVRAYNAFVDSLSLAVGLFDQQPDRMFLLVKPATHGTPTGSGKSSLSPTQAEACGYPPYLVSSFHPSSRPEVGRLPAFPLLSS